MDFANRKDVLIVDDDESIRALIAMSLDRLQVTCDTATDGADALDHVGRTSYQVIVVDLMMPKLDGSAFVIALRERETRSSERPVVVLMTAFPIREVPHLGTHVQMVVQKPFDVLELTELVRDCVMTRRMQDERVASAAAGAPASDGSVSLAATSDES